MTIDKLNYVNSAENIIKGMLTQDRRGNTVMPLTTSKIRGILSMVSELYTEAQHTAGAELSAELASQVQYLKMRIAYEAGRDRDVKAFVEKAGLMENLSDVKRDKAKLLLFCNYMEALVAYHRYYGGKDN